jgi:hypothetical protein
MLVQLRFPCVSVYSDVCFSAGVLIVNERGVLVDWNNGSRTADALWVHMSGRSGSYRCSEVHSWQQKYDCERMQSSLPNMLIRMTVSAVLQLAHVSLVVCVSIRSLEMRCITRLFTAKTHRTHTCFSHTLRIGNRESVKLVTVLSA